MKLVTKREATYKIKMGSGSDVAIIEVAPMSQTQLSKLREKHVKYSFQRGQRVEEVDYNSIHRSRVSKTIVDWEGILDEAGKPVPCTDEAKALIADLNPDFITELFEKCDKILLHAEEDAKKK